MKPCLSQASTMPASFTEDIEAYASAGVTAVEVWLTKLENALEQHPAGDLKKLACDKNIALVAASYQGGLLLSQGEQRRAHFDHFKRRLELCRHFNIPTLVGGADFFRH